METLRLAIVGSRSLDKDPTALAVVVATIEHYHTHHPRLIVVSGGAIGIDRIAIAEARRLGIGVFEYLPSGRGWRHYRARNLRIAHDCNRLIRIVDSRSRTYGSGWTRDRARELGKPTVEYVIDTTHRRILRGQS